MDFNDNPEFNDWLDETYPRVEIGEYSETPSVVLFEMDPKAYIDQLDAWKNQQIEEFPEVVVNEFPAPIAHYLHQTLHGFDDANHRLQLLRTTWESVIFTLYSLAVGEVLYRNVGLSGLQVGGQPLSYNRVMSERLADKLGFVDAVIKQDVGVSCLVISDIVSEEAIEGLRQLNQERNSIQHIAALNASQSEERFGQLFPKVKAILYELRGLRNVSFIQYRKSEPTPKDLKCRKFDGHTLARMNYPLCLTDTQFANIGAKLTANRLYAELGEDIFCVSPFAHVVDENHQTYLCFYKKKLNARSFRFERVGTLAQEFDLDGDQFQDVRNAIEGVLQNAV
ncbi:hypothetical protein Nhal_0895 [Nitrosococcus halophilus Nc 4]|uniref:Uncharacterized protein n=1 Tax=Nitrosococcus halophilus (strain Nc4) TaxID=472759 RepID=D5BY87_NITHN|nr:hypothetical protein [Nitrosococcus halophilus]ADE14070.1 hypothetical protein Nhal_0895 [Nitrosococcus halophilus Nc 4]